MVKKEDKYLSDDIFKDFLNNATVFEVYNRIKSIQQLKTLQLVFYEKTEDKKLQEKYLNHYMEVNPVFKQRYLSSNQKEQAKLLAKALNHAKEAYEEFIRHNFRLVVNIALKAHKKYSVLHLEKIDLIQEGNLGLIRAIEKFDVDKGNTFSTYAIWWIQAYIKQYIIKCGRSVYLPTHILAFFRNYHLAEKVLTAQLGKQPTIEEIAEYLQEPIYKIEKIARYRSQFLNISSLNDLINTDENAEIGDFIVDDSKSVEQEVEEKLLAENIKQLLENSSLTRPEREILSKRYALDNDEVYTLEKLSHHYEITKDQVRQIECRALKKLSKTLKETDYNQKSPDTVKSPKMKRP